MVDTKRMNAAEKLSWLNGLIMNIAIRGKTDSLGPIEINWKVVGRYAFVLIVEYTGKWWFQIIACQNGFQYDRKQVLSSIDKCEDSQIIYGYFRNINGSEQKLQKWRAGNWLEEISEIVAREIYE